MRIRVRKPRPTKTPRNVWEEMRNLPNILTTGRILLIPAVIWFMLQNTPMSAFIATLIFSVAAITDFLDGYIARKRGLISLWGQFLDPLADKLIVLATTVTLVFLRVEDPHSAWFGEPKLQVWLVVLLLAREMTITGLRGLAAQEGLTIAVTQSGKWKTALQLVGLIALLIGYSYEVDYLVWKGRVDFVIVGNIVLGLSVFFSLASAWAYLASFVSSISESQYREPLPRRQRRKLRFFPRRPKFPSFRKRRKKSSENRSEGEPSP